MILLRIHPIWEWTIPRINVIERNWWLELRSSLTPCGGGSSKLKRHRQLCRPKIKLSRNSGHWEEAANSQSSWLRWLLPNQVDHQRANSCRFELIMRPLDTWGTDSTADWCSPIRFVTLLLTCSCTDWPPDGVHFPPEMLVRPLKIGSVAHFPLWRHRSWWVCRPVVITMPRNICLLMKLHRCSKLEYFIKLSLCKFTSFLAA